jgi:hypothetical protein
MKHAAVAAALLLSASYSWAIQKCTGKDGKVIYQETPCEQAAQSQSVRVFAGQGETPARPVPAKPAAVAEVAPPAAAPTRPQATGAASLGPQTTTSDDDVVEQCLNWYRPRLKNPAGAYAGGVSRRGSVLSLTVYGTNSFGGYVAKEAACEVKNGRIDHDWTRIHAQRAGWP